MDPNSIVITLILSVTILTGLIVFIRSYYQKREIVIALTFDDQSKQLTIRTKTIHGQECVRKHHYSDLVLEYDRLSDGMTPQMYNTLTLAKGEYLAGHIYKNHFTWNEITVSEIETKLKKELKEITR